MRRFKQGIQYSRDESNERDRLWDILGRPVKPAKTAELAV
jgi:hypothetical protein